MKRVSPYLKMRVLGAIEFAPGNTIVARIRHISGQVFTDEDGDRFQFTWRTIQPWYSRYKKNGVTSMTPKPRSDRGHTRKVEPERLLEAIEQVRPSFRGPLNVTAIYRACIERGLLERQQVAPNTFRSTASGSTFVVFDFFRRTRSTTSCFSSNRTEPSLPTTPFRSRAGASKRRATSEIAKSRCASTA
jgi:hypothetical protein